jgi:hypothetical protein
MIARSLSLAAAALSLSGCILVDTGPPGGTVIGSGRGKPVGAPVSRIAAGIGAPDPGYDGVIITANVGGSYRVTWDNQWEGLTEVEGSVFSASGSTPQFFPGCTDGACSLMGGDQVIVGALPGRIDFIGYPSTRIGRSGFDIILPGGDNDQLLVDIFTNGVPDPDRVIFPATDFGGQVASAPTIPFALTTR